MSPKTQLQPEAEKTAAANGKNPVVSGVQSALRASMGVFSMGREEVETIINRMIEKGELTEIDGKKIVSNLFDRPRKGVRQINEKVGGVLDESIISTLSMLNVPTRSDLRTLSEKINDLAEKVDELSKKVSS
jgi:poly(hydroxyalkanoate) granule-associated protein